MLKNLLISVFIVLAAPPSEGQDIPVPRMAVNLGINRGFVIAHRPMVVPLQQNHVTGLEANLLLFPDGSKQWHHNYGFPEMGIALSVWDLGNKDQLGTGISLIPYLDFPLSKGKKTHIDLKFGWGIGYIDKIFNADDNHKNIAVGTHFNCALVLQPRIKFELTEQLALNGGLTLSHFSNGSIATPNLGLNLINITGSLGYKFGKQNINRNITLPPFVKSSRVTFFAAGAMKQVYPAEGKNYFALTFSVNRYWQSSRKSAFGLGLDLFYDNSIDQKLDERNIEHNSPVDAMRVGLNAGYEMAISDLSIIINLGGYLYTRLYNDGTIYQRIGIRYRVTEKLFVLMQLKSHWGKADFLEWGLGYRIDKFKSK